MLERRPSALFAMEAQHLPLLFPPDLRERLTAVADIDPELVVSNFSSDHVRSLLSTVEVLITGWGCPHLSLEVLDAAPRLRAVLHTGGSVKHLLPPEGWQRVPVVSSAAAANALPVAEYTLGMVLLAGKGVFALRDAFRARRGFTLGEVQQNVGNFGRTVGIIGASRIGRRLMELLRPFDLDVALYDPYVTEAEARALGVRPAGLPELLAGSDIVSVHAPATPETTHLIDAAALALMRDGAVLINTSRGSLVDTRALTAELVSGRLEAILDVTDPEPLPGDSPLYDLPNVLLTPHIAGSHGNELRRLGLTAVEELERLTSGRPPLHRVHPAELHRAA
ncbi:hydroxyacid dehydrogenase [Streptomyces litchfieldiae]|uniref:Hydroxyacid dehydrogenase n=1 Tax=Streptomyces litchfieldiae TaxID=3075543 RepID=A0ABU2MIV4_9ACTN|nr:hydroxyacid dehydrogenase [Streptomyces sp. DSM 44938]MDT0341509.1 hydroxyacid dehydrogenase [Streptomyces sp. DSM 44938]